MGTELLVSAARVHDLARDIHRRIALESDRLFQQEIHSKITLTDQ